MKVLYYIKTTLKGMLSNGVVTIGYFICFPIIIAAFMGFVQSTDSENPLKLKPLKVEIVDQDNTEMSQKLVDWIKSNDIKEIADVVDKDPEVKLLISKGYGEKVINLEAGNIEIDKITEGRELTVDTFKTLLNKYHKNLYVAIQGGDLENLNSLDNNAIIKNITIDIKEGADSYGKMASSMLGFVITMLMFSMIQGGYVESSINLDKRIHATPISKLQYLIYDSIAMVIYALIILTAYVLFFRIAGIAFIGNIPELFILVILGALIAVSMSKCITTLFGVKYGRAIGTVAFIIPVAAGEIFMGEGNSLAALTPTHYLNNAFNLYNLNGNLQGCGKWILIVFATAFVLFLLAIIKVMISRRKGICA